MRPERYVIGLTGNIATGKSTVASMLARLGAHVIDADRLAHKAMRPGTAIFRRIVQRFGAEMVGSQGELDRTRLGAAVFADPAALQDLERIVHPAVIQLTQRCLRASQTAICVIEAIKLIEAQMHAGCHAIWVVTSRREQQVARLMATRGLTRSQVEQRIEAQPPPEAKLAYADRVVDNSGSLGATWAQVLGGWNAIPGVVPVSPDTPWGATTKDERA